MGQSITVREPDRYLRVYMGVHAIDLVGDTYHTSPQAQQKTQVVYDWDRHEHKHANRGRQSPT
jgi:hypothetical protein